MTFLQLTDDDSRDLAIELWYSGDAATLDEAAALAADMQDVVRSCAAEWDADAGYVLMPEGDLLGPDGLRY